MIINTCHEPKILFVGASNLMSTRYLHQLTANYASNVPSDFKRHISYYSLSGDSKNNKYLKKDFLEDVKDIKEFCEVNDITSIVVTSAKFWNFATKDKNFMSNMESGNILSGVGELSGYNIIPVLNLLQLLPQPQKRPLMEKSLETLSRFLKGEYVKTELILDKVNVDVIDTIDRVEWLFESYLPNQKVITMDIEGTGLYLGKDRIITLAFAVSETEGYSVPLCEEYWLEITKDKKLAEAYNKIARGLAKKFYENYRGLQVWHNMMFDIPFIMRELLEIDPSESFKINSTINNWNLEDTMIMKYLCVNSIERVSLGLKDILLPFYGEYDKDINQSDLLSYSYYDVGKYNIYDVTGTYLAYNMYRPKVKEEEQEEIYQQYYKPNSKQLIKFKYRGVILDTDKLEEAESKLNKLMDEQREIIANSPYVRDVEDDLNYDAMYKYNTTHIKQKTLSDFDIRFNPNSTAHKKRLLIDTMGLDVLETTATGNPSLGRDVIKKYMQEPLSKDKLKVLEALLSLSTASKVATAFLSSFDKLKVQDKLGYYRLHGDLKIANVVSGRLSAANPNLQQVPSGSEYGSLVQRLIVPPKGYIFAGSDYNALESRVSAYITEDEASVKVIKDNYDSHALATSVYFQEQLAERGLPNGPDITAEESHIIKEKASDLRQKSKSVTLVA